MASTAHCIFCFEVLTSELERRKRLSLPVCEELWARYQVHLDRNRNDGADSASDEADIGGTSHTLPTPPRSGGVARLQSQSDSPVSGSGKSTPSTDASSSSSNLSHATSASANASANSTTDSASKTSSKSSLLSSFARKVAAPVNDAEPEYPIFVTWNELDARNRKSLRGCIGTFEGAPLAQHLETYAITSAFHDHRFSPITTAELPRLSCALTLLTNFTPCAAGPLDWTLGTHGLRLAFNHHGRRYSATYLPDVAPEQGWSKEETVVSLMRKAGWNGHRRDWNKVADLKATRYEGDKASLDWEDYRAWRAWVVAEGLA